MSDFIVLVYYRFQNKWKYSDYEPNENLAGLTPYVPMIDIREGIAKFLLRKSEVDVNEKRKILKRLVLEQLKEESKNLIKQIEDLKKNVDQKKSLS